ncbi:MAG: hypothetical protein MOGMAGMI_00290 [Candidatus Omnitrophica bacterium]|nr:hypothetical protein [Candidatus Omnitrophota bacterium]
MGYNIVMKAFILILLLALSLIGLYAIHTKIVPKGELATQIERLFSL